jgi:immunity protein, SdpI family
MRRWLPASLIAGAWLFSIAVYSRLPDRVPVHWDLSGEPNRYGSRIEGAFLLPVLMIAMYLVMQWYPSRDPRAANIAKFRGAYDTVVAAMIAFLCGVHILILGQALGWRVDITTIALVGVGAMLVIVGNLLPLARSNFIFGIRTPWTLSSEQVWARAHRVGGYAAVVAGLVTIASAFLGRPVGLVIALTTVFVAGLIPIVYSYVLWSRERP